MELDQEIRMDLIRDHDVHPRHYAVLENPSCQGYNYNPRCGDKYTVYVVQEGDRLAKVNFMGWGCAVSKASASMMCEAMEGLSQDEGKQLLHDFRKMVAGEPHQLDPDRHFDLFVFSSIHQNPLRQQCATLAWGALEEALKDA